MFIITLFFFFPVNTTPVVQPTSWLVIRRRSFERKQNNARVKINQLHKTKPTLSQGLGSSFSFWQVAHSPKSLRAGNSGPIFVCLCLISSCIYCIGPDQPCTASFLMVQNKTKHSPPKGKTLDLWSLSMMIKKITLLLCLYRQKTLRCYLKLRNLSVLKSSDNRGQICTSAFCLPSSLIFWLDVFHSQRTVQSDLTCSSSS